MTSLARSSSSSFALASSTVSTFDFSPGRPMFPSGGMMVFSLARSLARFSLAVSGGGRGRGLIGSTLMTLPSVNVIRSKGAVLIRSFPAGTPFASWAFPSRGPLHAAASTARRPIPIPSRRPEPWRPRRSPGRAGEGFSDAWEDFH